MASEKQPSSSVRSVNRSFDILELLGARSKVSLSDVARYLGLPRSSAHAILTTLCSRGYASYSAGDRTYSIGIRAWELGQQFRVYDAIVTHAAPEMESLVENLNEICQLAVRDGRQLVYLHKVESQQPMQLLSRPGTRLNAHASGLGKALLSALGDSEIDELYAGVELEAFTPSTISTVDDLKRELAQIRRIGIAEDREEYVPGLRCIATPVVDSTGRPIAAISVSLSTVRCTESWRKRAIPALQASARAISTALGART